MAQKGLLVWALGIVGTVALAANAMAADIQSATWVPGTGSPTALVDGGAPVALTTVVSQGKVVVVTDYASPVTQVNVAYAIDYDADDAWAESGTTRYHTLNDALISYAAQGSGTRVTAVIPMVNEPGFHPALIDADQKLYVYVGRPGVMTINPTSGVTGADDTALYQVNTDQPTHTIIPDDASHITGVMKRGNVEFTIELDHVVESDLTYSLSYTGPSGLMAALTLPTSVTVPVGSCRAIATITLTPTNSPDYPTGISILDISATSSLGTIQSLIRFGGILFDADPPLSAQVDEDEDCTPSTVPAQQPPANTGPPCGKCVKTSATPSCPHNLPSQSTGDYIWYFKFKCEDDGTCTYATTQVQMAASTVTTYIQACDIPRGLVLRAHQTAFKAKTGHQCCFTVVPSSTVNVYSIPDCS